MPNAQDQWVLTLSNKRALSHVKSANEFFRVQDLRPP